MCESLDIGGPGEDAYSMFNPDPLESIVHTTDTPSQAHAAARCQTVVMPGALRRVAAKDSRGFLHLGNGARKRQIAPQE